MHQTWFLLLAAAASATRLESFNAGLRATQKGDADAALSHFQAAVKADGDLGKDDVSLHLALGEALSRAGAHAEAAQHLQQALDLCYEHELGDKVYGAVEYNLAVATEDAAGEQAAARAEELYRDAAAHGLSPALYNLAVLVGKLNLSLRLGLRLSLSISPSLSLRLSLSLSLTLALSLPRCSWASQP